MSHARFLLATRSEGKLRELREIFSEFGLDIVTLSELGITETVEEEDLERFDTFLRTELGIIFKTPLVMLKMTQGR